LSGLLYAWIFSSGGYYVFGSLDRWVTVL